VSTNPDSTPSAADATSDALLDEARAALQAEITDQKDRYLRLAADFDNHRKRLARDLDRRAD